MVYQILLDNLRLIFGNNVQWVITGTEIIAFIITLLFTLLFLSIPTYLFYYFITLFTEKSSRKRRKRK